jgi:aminobenzoyl-glutamate transport protein
MIALMLPYSAAFGAAGMLLILAWVGFQLPVGPGAPAAYHLPTPAAVSAPLHPESAVR